MISGNRAVKAFASLESVVQLLQDELAATNREVLLLTLELEQRVADRTAELSQINAELSQEVIERKRAEAEVRKLNQDLAERAALLEEANRELEAFSYSVSHDLRAPLRHVIGFTTILKEQMTGRLDRESHQLMDRICEGASGMATLIDKLLHFSRLSRVQLSTDTLQLDDMVTGVIQEFEGELQGRAVVWKRDPLPDVHADPVLLRQVFVNLISNALKYSSKSNPAEIEIGYRRQEQTTVFFVRDNGVGFDPAYADKLFGVFQRLHRPDEFEGTGIGLANVRRIVSRHGGSTWAESQLERGATFYFSLPQEIEGQSHAPFVCLPEISTNRGL